MAKDTEGKKVRRKNKGAKSNNLNNKIEALFLTSGEPISLRRLNEVLNPLGISSKQIQNSLIALGNKHRGGVMRLVKSASGYTLHVGEEYAGIVNQFKQDKPARYSRALMETLSIIAYKQPITKAEIEELRGVTLSAGIMRTMQEHEWIKILGHKDVPGKPAIWGTTKVFLDSFNLSSLKDLPELVMDEAEEEESSS